MRQSKFYIKWLLSTSHITEATEILHSKNNTVLCNEKSHKSYRWGPNRVKIKTLKKVQDFGKRKVVGKYNFDDGSNSSVF